MSMSRERKPAHTNIYCLRLVQMCWFLHPGVVERDDGGDQEQEEMAGL